MIRIQNKVRLATLTKGLKQQQQPKFSRKGWHTLPANHGSRNQLFQSFSSKPSADQKTQEIKEENQQEEEAFPVSQSEEPTAPAEPYIHPRMSAFEKAKVRYNMQALEPFENLDPLDVPFRTKMANVELTVKKFMVWTPRFQLQNPSEELLEFLEDEKFFFEKEKLKRRSDPKLTNLMDLDDDEADLLDDFDEFHKKYENNQKQEIGQNVPLLKRMHIYRKRHLRLVKGFVEDIVAKNPEYDYIENYKIYPSKTHNIHGNVDFLIYNTNPELYSFPCLPIIVPQVRYSKFNDTISFDPSLAPITAVLDWFQSLKLSNAKRDPKLAALIENYPHIESQAVIWTTGHIWQIFDVNTSLNVRRSHKYKPKTVATLLRKENLLFGRGQNFDQNEMKIWNDFELIQVVLGMLKHGMNNPGAGERKLEAIYDYLKELTFMEKISEKDKEIMIKRDRAVGRFLPRGLRKWIVGADPAEKNIYGDLDFSDEDGSDNFDEDLRDIRRARQAKELEDQ